MPDELVVPDYEPMLAAYHSAFRSELECIVTSLPIVEGSLVLDMACGDGEYTSWLDRLAGKDGCVVALDVSKAYLQIAKQQLERTPFQGVPNLVAGSIEKLPFADQTFDAIWCAQCLFSLSEPVQVISQMIRVVKDGGLVAILEDDKLHQVLLPWPVPIELAVRAAEWQILRDKSPQPDKFYVGRRLVEVFRECGLEDLEVRSYAHSRIGPLDGFEREFLKAYLEDLRGRVVNRIDPVMRNQFLGLVDPDSSTCLLDYRDLQMTVIDHVIIGRVRHRAVGN